MQVTTNHPGKIKKYIYIRSCRRKGTTSFEKFHTHTPGNAGLFFLHRETSKLYDSVFPESEVHVGAQQEVSDQPSHVQDKGEVVNGM